MDNFKLKAFCNTFILIVISINWSCNASENSKVFEKIDLKKWNAVTEKFMIDKCPSFNELSKPLEPILAIQNGMTFNTTADYLHFLLTYRKFILDQLSTIDFKNARKITIEENYQRNEWSSARIIISNNNSQKKKIYHIIKDEKIIALNDEEINDFIEYNYENDCEVFVKYTVISQMRIVTDFLLTGEYLNRKVALFE